MAPQNSYSKILPSPLVREDGLSSLNLEDFPIDEEGDIVVNTLLENANKRDREGISSKYDQQRWDKFVSKQQNAPCDCCGG